MLLVKTENDLYEITGLRILDYQIGIKSISRVDYVTAIRDQIDMLNRNKFAQLIVDNTNSPLFLCKGTKVAKDLLYRITLSIKNYQNYYFVLNTSLYSNSDIISF